jgi:hypothetical protein
VYDIKLPRWASAFRIHIRNTRRGLLAREPRNTFDSSVLWRMPVDVWRMISNVTVVLHLFVKYIFYVVLCNYDDLKIVDLTAFLR